MLTSLSHAVTSAAANGWDAAPLFGVATLLWAGWRLVLIGLFPLRPCRSCRGTGKIRSGRFWRPCRSCRGSGGKVRAGRRVWSYVTREHADT